MIGVDSMKITKSFRLDAEVIQMMETLIPFLSSEKNIKLNNTTLLEMLVSERYERLINESKGNSESKN